MPSPPDRPASVPPAAAGGQPRHAAAPDEPPLIVTLALDAAGFARLDGLRRRHFPPARNMVPAHVTLFHRLPGDGLATVGTALAAACAEQPPLALTTSGPRLLGFGVALGLDAPELPALRARLASELAPLLGRQDRQPFRPHVTIQNKVAPAAARALAAELAGSLPPLHLTGQGLLLWRYLGGPWQAETAFAFAGAPAPPRFPPAPPRPTSGRDNGEPG